MSSCSPCTSYQVILSSVTHTETLQWVKNLQKWLKTYFSRNTAYIFLRRFFNNNAQVGLRIDSCRLPQLAGGDTVWRPDNRGQIEKARANVRSFGGQRWRIIFLLVVALLSVIIVVSVVMGSMGEKHGLSAIPNLIPTGGVTHGTATDLP